jgi:hypothetical protein
MTVSSLNHVPTSARLRYGRSSGITRSGAAWYRRCWPSSPALEISARLTPALRMISIACGTGTSSQASWL